MSQLTHSRVYRQGYLDGWINAYDDLLHTLKQQGITTSELDRIDAWVESDLASWVECELAGKPPVLKESSINA